MQKERIASIFFSLIVCIIVCLITKKGAFESYEQTKVLVFSFTMAAVFVGIFNSIMIYDKQKHYVEEDIGNGKYSCMQYMIAVTASELWLCFLQAVIFSSCFIIFFSDSVADMESLVFKTVRSDIFFTSLLTITAGMSIGLFVGLVFKLEITIFIMPFIMIIEMLLSSCIFDLDGILEIFSHVVLSRYSAASFGAILNLNEYPLKITLTKNIPIDLEPQDIYRHISGYVVSNWIWIIIITIVFLFLSYIALSRHAKKITR